jgi:hypothetical protein
MKEELCLIKDLYGLCHLRLKPIENEIEYEKNRMNQKLGARVPEAQKEKFSFENVNESGTVSTNSNLPPGSFLSRMNEDDVFTIID